MRHLGETRTHNLRIVNSFMATHRSIHLRHEGKNWLVSNLMQLNYWPVILFVLVLVCWLASAHQ